MKKLFLTLAVMLMSISAFAFEFDGINLNDDALKITRAIATKHYVTDPVRNCFKGNCQGNEIYLSFNLEDVTTKGKVGQLIVDVPMKNAEAYDNCVSLLNVIYHQVSKSDNGIVYAVDEDGTTLLLQKGTDGIKLTYNTPFYQAKK